MVKYSHLFLPYCLAFWAVCFMLLPFCFRYGEWSGFALRVGQTLFKTYGNLGQMMVYFCGFTLLYYRYKGQKVLDRIAPVGRMSVTNYMARGIRSSEFPYSMVLAGTLLSSSTICRAFAGSGFLCHPDCL